MESKIDLVDRLRAEGRWAEASLFKDAKVKELRGQGTPRAEAAEQAWAAMATAFPPRPPAEQLPEPRSAAPPVETSTEVGTYSAVVGTYGEDEKARGETAFDIRLFDALLVGIERWSRHFGINLPPYASRNLFPAVLASVDWCYDRQPTPLPPPETAPPSAGASAKVEIDVENERAKNLASFDMLLFDALPFTICNWRRVHSVNVPPDANQGLFITVLVAVIWAWRRLPT